METRQPGVQDFEARIQDLLAHKDYRGAAALKETMERETAVREAEQRTEGEQKERLGDRVPEASPATPQKQAQLDATTDGAEEDAATEAEQRRERELQEQTKEALDREDYTGAAALRQLAMLAAATEEAEQRQQREFQT